MKVSWLNGLSEEQKAEMKKEFVSSVALRRRLSVLTNEKIETSRTAARQKNLYDSPSWALLQADNIGYERALFEIISLLE